jgi:hypothetical protein
LDWHRKARHYRFQFLWNATRVSEVGDDEAGEPPEFGAIGAARLVIY